MGLGLCDCKGVQLIFNGLNNYSIVLDHRSTVEEESIEVWSNEDIGSCYVRWRISFEFTGCTSGGWLSLIILIDSFFKISSSWVPANVRAIREAQKSIDMNNLSLTNQILGQQHWISATVMETDFECFEHQAGMLLG